MDNKRIISFSTPDSSGNVRVTLGNVNAFESHRQHLLDHLRHLHEQTYNLIKDDVMTKVQAVEMLEVAECLDDIITRLKSDAL